jgi:hypothetical protein
MTTDTGSTDLTGTGWFHVAAVRDDTNNKAYGYVNGVAEGDTSDSADGDFTSSTSDEIKMGCWDADGERRFSGDMDEIRISKIARTISWINASYLSGKDEFITYGSEEEYKPFYIQETPAKAMKECSTNPLSANEFCNITWTVNATGALNSVWEVGVLFNSTTAGVDDNHTDNATITITSIIESMQLSWGTINFQSLSPNTVGNNATKNDQGYNITNKGTCTLQTWINGTDLINSTVTPVPSTIGVGNISYSNSTNDYASSTQMTTSYALIGPSHAVNTNITLYYWFNVPSIYAGNYTGNVTICGNCTGGSSCE